MDRNIHTSSLAVRASECGCCPCPYGGPWPVARMDVGQYGVGLLSEVSFPVIVVDDDDDHDAKTTRRCRKREDEEWPSREREEKRRGKRK